MPIDYAAGTFPFPTSTGSFSVTDIGVEPEMVIFFGGNQATEDTLLTGLTRPGIFLSVCARDWSSGNVNVACISIAGTTAGGVFDTGYSRTQSTTGGYPIRMQNNVSGSGIDYRASQITFDADGFTLTVSHAAPGNRPIHWWVVNSDDKGLASVLRIASDGSPFIEDTGFQIESFLGLGGPTDDASSEKQGNSDSWLFFGTNHWPNDADTHDSRFAALTHTGHNNAGAAGNQGWTEQLHLSSGTGHYLMMDLGTSGPALDGQFMTAYPDALFSSTAELHQADVDVMDQQNVVWTGIAGNAQSLVSSASIGGIVEKSVPTWFDEFGIVMFTTINGPSAVGEGIATNKTRLRYGVGVLHEDYQGCVVMGDDGSFYQSTNKCMANCTAAGAEAVVGEIIGDTFEVETVLGGSIDVTYHGFELDEEVPTTWQRRRYTGAVP